MHHWQSEPPPRHLLLHRTGSLHSLWWKSRLSASRVSNGEHTYTLRVGPKPSQGSAQLTLWAVFNAFFLPLIYFFYPETQNLTLEQIDKLFTGDKVLLHWKASMDTTETSQDNLAGTFAEKNDVKHIDEKHTDEKESL